MDALRNEVRRHVAATSLEKVAELKNGLTIGEVRSAKDGRPCKSTTIQKLCDALDLEFYIGPPREPSGTEPVPTPVAPAPGMGTWPANWLFRLAEFFYTLPDECPFTKPGRECPLLAAAKRARQLN